MVEKTIELTDDQLKKVEILQSNGIGIGDAIDMLFKVKEDVAIQGNKFFDTKIAQATEEKTALEEEIKKIDEEIAIFNKLKDTSLDFEQKQEILEKEYGNIDDSYEVQVQNAKRNISWAKDFFKF